MATKTMADKPTRLLGYAPGANESEPTNKTGGFIKQVLYSKWLNWILKTITDWLDYYRYQDVDLYVDADAGSDSNSGLSTSLPFATLDKALTTAARFGNNRIHLMANTGGADNYYSITDRYEIRGNIQILNYSGNSTYAGVVRCEITSGAGSKRNCGGFNLFGASSIHIDILKIQGDLPTIAQTYNTDQDCAILCTGGNVDVMEKQVNIVTVLTDPVSTIGTADYFYIVRGSGSFESSVSIKVKNFDISDNTKVYLLDQLTEMQSLHVTSGGDSNTQYVCQTIVGITLSGAPLAKIPAGITNSEYIWEHLP